MYVVCYCIVVGVAAAANLAVVIVVVSVVVIVVVCGSCLYSQKLLGNLEVGGENRITGLDTDCITFSFGLFGYFKTIIDPTYLLYFDGLLFQACVLFVVRVSTFNLYNFIIVI